MVATVIRLRYRALGNSLIRSIWQLIGFCAAALWGAMALLLLAAGLVALAIAGDVVLAQTVIVVAGCALMLGWMLAPILVAGMDSTVDAARLAPFPLTRVRIQVVLTAVGLTGIPGAVATLIALGSAAVWWRTPVAAIVAVPLGALGVVTCVLAGRLTTSLATEIGGHRRGREVIGTVVLVIIVLLGPIALWIAAALTNAADIGAWFVQAGAVLGWTPLGAAWGVAPALADGEWVPALAKALIAAATASALWLGWGRLLASTESLPSQQSTRTAAAGAIGWFGRMPATPLGATWARSLTAWTRDPRYLRSLLMVPLFPVLFAFVGGVDFVLFQSSAILVATALAISGYADVSYDSTAFATVMSTGIRGRDDRLGRLLAYVCIGVPLIVLVALATSLISGSWHALPAVLGAALGVVLAGYGISAVSSALIVNPVPEPGDSPFKSVPGQTFLSGIAVFAVMFGSLLLAVPAIVLAVVSVVTTSVLYGWLSLGAGLIVGVGVMIGGVIWGGRIFDRTGPELLARIRAFPH